MPARGGSWAFSNTAVKSKLAQLLKKVIQHHVSKALEDFKPFNPKTELLKIQSNKTIWNEDKGFMYKDVNYSIIHNTRKVGKNVCKQGKD